MFNVSVTLRSVSRKRPYDWVRSSPRLKQLLNPLPEMRTWPRQGLSMQSSKRWTTRIAGQASASCETVDPVFRAEQWAHKRDESIGSVSKLEAAFHIRWSSGI